MPPRILRIHGTDNVAIALADLSTGEEAAPGVILREAIPRGHKIALEPIAKGATVRKFALPIGSATEAIPAGAHVHSHNLAFADAGISASREGSPARSRTAPAERTFEGYLRPDGRVGTRNYIGIIPTVNCSATVARAIAQRFSGPALDAWPEVDGVVPLVHGGGCGTSAGEPLDVLRRTLGGFATHPNFAGVLVLGLGCEVNQIEGFLADQHLDRSPMLRTFGIQEEGGTSATIRAGVEAVTRMIEEANGLRRETHPVSHLTLGLQCGGSDGFSGLTANPALGAAADILVQHGGTAVLSETPEIYGAESLLLDRAAGPAVAEKLLKRLSWWRDHVAMHGQSLDNNPSPGNKAGGLTTILEKSLGAVAKGGTSPLMDVFEYGERIAGHGFVFMDTPGYDPMSVTGQVAGGCNIVAFTTGRGSCFGCKPAPTLKLATNSDVYRRMTEDMDFNCGDIVEGTETVAGAGQRFFELLIETASGRPTASERNGYGDDEFVPWLLGATL